MVDIGRIIDLLKNDKIKWSAHGLMRIQERGIVLDDIRRCVESGEVIDNYLEEPPAKSSVLIYGKAQDGKVIHVVLGYDDDQLYFVTAYYPSLEKFEDDLKTRRK